MKLSVPGTEPTAVALSGALDIAGAKKLHGELLELARTSSGDVTLDCSAVDRIDAAGAQLLYALAQALSARGSSLEVVGVPESASRLLTIAGLGSLLSNQGNRGNGS